MDCIDGLKELNDESIDLIIIDPPYNTGMTPQTNSGFNNGWGKQRSRLNSFFDDKFDPLEYEYLMRRTFKELYRVLKNNKPIYVFIDYRNLCLLKRWLRMANFSFKQQLVWDKQIHGLNYQNYAYQHEYILYFVKGEYTHKRLYNRTDVISYARVNNDNKINHETVKPITLIRNLIKDNSDPGDLVLDCFMGSGTTAVASKQAGRNFIGFESNEAYVQICERRLKQDVLFDERRSELP